MDTNNSNLEAPEEPTPPVGLLGRLFRVARHNPVAELVGEQLQKVESRVLGELRSRMDKLNAPVQAASDDDCAPLSGHATEALMAQALAISAGRSSTPRKPSAVMAELLARSQEQSKEQAQESLHSLTLKLLTPDEARILSALSDGTVFCLINVLQSPLLGAAQMVLENASNAGRAAGVQLINRVPVYVTRLRAFGLVDFGPEEPALQLKYEILETDASIIDAINLIEDKRRQSAKIQRRSLFISAFGRELWEFGHRPFTASSEGGKAISHQESGDKTS